MKNQDLLENFLNEADEQQLDMMIASETIYYGLLRNQTADKQSPFIDYI